MHNAIMHKYNLAYLYPAEKHTKRANYYYYKLLPHKLKIK